MLAAQDLSEIQKKLEGALSMEKGNLDRLREKVRQLQVRELGYRQCYAVAPVATDGGENNLSLEPMNVEIVRDGKVALQQRWVLELGSPVRGTREGRSADYILVELSQISFRGSKALDNRRVTCEPPGAAT
jgi:hypothetical protein